MNERHLAAAVRYVELNPVRAHLVTQAKEWKWSSAHAHLTGTDNTLVRVEPMLKLFSDWTAYLAEHDEEDADCIRVHTRTGRPLGDWSFVQMAESLTGRTLARQRPGRKPKTASIQ